MTDEGKDILTKSAKSPYGTTQSDENLRPGDQGTDDSRWRWSSIYRRHFMAFMAFLGFGNIYAMRANLTVAILEMTSNRTVVVNGSQLVIAGEFQHWDSVTRGAILSSFFYGYICTQLPGGLWARLYGGKLVYLIGVLGWSSMAIQSILTTSGTSLLTLLTPLLVHFGKTSLMLTRVLEGLFEGVTYPAIHALWSHWAPPLEKTKLVTIGFAGSYFGTVVSMPLSAYLGENYGWPSIFYVFGLLALIWCLCWFKWVQEVPAKDPYITKDELIFIEKEIVYVDEHLQSPPWRHIVTSKPVWAIVIAHFCENWGFYTMLTNLPMFMKDVLHYRLEMAGLLTSLPYMVMGSVVIFSGQFADYLRAKKQWDTVKVRKTFCSGAFLCQTVFLLFTAHSPSAPLAVCTITLAIGLGGFAWSGFSVNHLDLAPQHASVLMGVSNTFATLAGILSPLLIGLIVTEGHVWQWRIVLYLAASFYALGAICFSLLASGDRQSWAQFPSGYTSRLNELNTESD